MKPDQTFIGPFDSQEDAEEHLRTHFSGRSVRAVMKIETPPMTTIDWNGSHASDRSSGSLFSLKLWSISPWFVAGESSTGSQVDRKLSPMGTDIRAFLAIDDNTPADKPPFTNDPSCWDLSYDIGLSSGNHYEFYAAIAGVRNDTGKEPLIAPRGLRKYRMIAPVEDLCDDFGVGWLTLGEIEKAQHAQTMRNERHVSS
jgi:hypothetical protein